MIFKNFLYELSPPPFFASKNSYKYYYPHILYKDIFKNVSNMCMDMIGTCVWECYEIAVWKAKFVV
jgi:hypothetical protein